MVHMSVPLDGPMFPPMTRRLTAPTVIDRATGVDLTYADRLIVSEKHR